MRKDDIRFSGKAATIEHHSSRGKVIRNAGNFTRGSQLVTHEFWMWFSGVKIPFWIWLLTFVVAVSITLILSMERFEAQLVLMRLWSTFWTSMGFDPMKFVNVTLPTGHMSSMPMAYVPDNPYIANAWDKAVRCLLGSGFMAAFVAAPLSIWFIDFSRKRGRSVLQERHERGALLVERDVLRNEIKAHNASKLREECAALNPPRDWRQIARLSALEKRALGIPQPYSIAGVPFPWRLEQSHTMLIGTTGAGKTTQLRSLVKQIRARGHRAVIFDLTGTFVESFYNEETDVILNPMDQRCRAWTIFNDCKIYADFLSAATALIPSDPGDKEPFWQLAARTLFVETCVKLVDMGEMSNAAIAHHLMTADLKKIHAILEDTVAGPLTSEKAARMAESIRSVLNVNANVIRFLIEASSANPEFSINDWIGDDSKEGSILFITSNHTDLALTRSMLTLWMDLAVNALMRLPRTRHLRTWFLFDEVHALHALPAIEHGLQTARNFGGAFVLGIHSFDKLVETYGEQGAVSLAGLARTKLILATADYRSAERCAEFIGNREVRQVDEAYSYGYNNTRDASTLTPRKMIEPLVIPDDITNLPSMHGFIKFPDGFPAARIKLQWQDYPETAVGFIRVTTMNTAPYVSPGDVRRAGQKKRAEEEGQGGREAVPTTGPDEARQIEQEDPDAKSGGHDNRSEAEKAAEAMLIRGDVAAVLSVPQYALPAPANDTAAAAVDPEPRIPPSPSTGRASSLGVGSLGLVREDADIQRTKAAQAMTERAPGAEAKDRPEEQILRETREGAGVAPLHGEHHHAKDDAAPEIDDDMDQGI